MEYSSIKKKDRVLTADEQDLGEAIRIYTNPNSEDVDPELKLFEHYLLVMNYGLGDNFFVPTDYIDHYDAEARQVVLKISMKKVQHETLTREPNFIAHGRAKKTELEEA